MCHMSTSQKLKVLNLSLLLSCIGLNAAYSETKTPEAVVTKKEESGEKIEKEKKVVTEKKEADQVAEKATDDKVSESISFSHEKAEEKDNKIIDTVDYTEKKVHVNGIRVEKYSARILKGSKNGSAYMTFIQSGKEGDILLSASSPICETVELHDHIHDKETKAMKMVKVDSIDIPGTHSNCSFLTCWFKAKESPVVLKKGGMHIMFMNLKPEAYDAKMIPLTLKFKNAGEITVELPLESMLPHVHDEHCQHHKH